MKRLSAIVSFDSNNLWGVKCRGWDYLSAILWLETGGLYRMGVSLMQLFSENHKDFIPLADILGTHFQIRDDYINLKQDSVRVHTLQNYSIKTQGSGCILTIISTWSIRDFAKI